MRLALTKFLQPDKQDRRKLNWESFGQYRDDVMTDFYQTPDSLTIDLEGVDIFGHDGLIWVLSLAAWRQYENVGPTFVQLPSRMEYLKFLNRLRFPQAVLNAGALLTNERLLWNSEISADIHPYPQSLRYFQFIANTTWSAVTSSLVMHFEPDLQEFYRTKARDRLEDVWPFLKSLHELIHNVAMHGGDETGGGVGFACYRAMPRGFPLLRFCTTDLSRGFKTTLEEQDLWCADEEEAIQRALLYRHTRPRSGVLGLYRALKFIRDIGGNLRIRSADVLLTINLLKRDEIALFDEGYTDPSIGWIREMSRVEKMPKIRGTHVTLDLKLPREITHRAYR